MLLIQKTKEKRKWKLKKIKVLASEFEPNKMHIYEVKTKGKHPVHLIDFGDYITEDNSDFGDGDMGRFWLNQKEYDYFKSQLKEVIIEVNA